MKMRKTATRLDPYAFFSSLSLCFPLRPPLIGFKLARSARERLVSSAGTQRRLKTTTSLFVEAVKSESHSGRSLTHSRALTRSLVLSVKRRTECRSRINEGVLQNAESPLFALRIDFETSPT